MERRAERRRLEWEIRELEALVPKFSSSDDPETAWVGYFLTQCLAHKRRELQALKDGQPARPERPSSGSPRISPTAAGGPAPLEASNAPELNVRGVPVQDTGEPE